MSTLAVALACAPWVAAAQPATQNVEVEPVTCWWRTDTTAIRVGQSFRLILTCSILETEAARAIVDRSRLGSAAVQFPPYEVLSGTASTDHVTPGRRFAQYEYTLRLISEDAFGADVPIPEMAIAYRIESTVTGNAAVQGLEMNYVLPALPMRVASLVPADATHIREQAVPTLPEIAGREFRGRTYRLVGLMLVGLAGLVALVGVVSWARRHGSGARDETRHLLADRTVIAGVRQELRRVQQDTRAGWSPETVARALAASRVVGSYLGGAPVSQRESSGDLVGGELAVGAGTLVRRRVVISGAATSHTLTTPGSPATRDAAAVHLDGALITLTRARYGRVSPDGGALDDALQTAATAADRLASRHTWLAEQLAAVKRRVRSWGPRAWAR